MHCGNGIALSGPFCAAKARVSFSRKNLRLHFEARANPIYKQCAVKLEHAKGEPKE